MAESSGIVSPEWFISDNTYDNFANAVDERLLENLQDQDLDRNLVITITQKVDFCHSRRQLATPISDHEVEVRTNNTTEHSTRPELLQTYSVLGSNGADTDSQKHRIAFLS